MKVVANPTNALRLREVAMGLILGVVLIAATTPVHADDDRWGNHGRQNAGDRDWRGHEEHAGRYWNQPYFRDSPGVIYAPPVVYEPPQYEEPGVSLIFPLNIR